MNLLLQLKYDIASAKNYETIDYVCRYGLGQVFPWQISLEENLDGVVKKEFCRLTALYIVVRKACGLQIPNEISEALLNVSPLGANTPILKEWLTAKRIAIICVPLAGLDGCNPMLAMRFQMDESRYWQNGVNPIGHSYRLADAMFEGLDLTLQEEVLRYWIVTGDCTGKSIGPVELGNKFDLIERYPNRKWILPRANGVACSSRQEFYSADTLVEALAIVNDVNYQKLFDIVQENNLKLFESHKKAYLRLIIHFNKSQRKALRKILERSSSGEIYESLLKAGLYDDVFLERCSTEESKSTFSVFLKKTRKIV